MKIPTPPIPPESLELLANENDWPNREIQKDLRLLAQWMREVLRVETR